MHLYRLMALLDETQSGHPDMYANHCVQVLNVLCGKRNYAMLHCMSAVCNVDVETISCKHANPLMWRLKLATYCCIVSLVDLTHQKILLGKITKLRKCSHDAVNIYHLHDVFMHACPVKLYAMELAWRLEPPVRILQIKHTLPSWRSMKYFNGLMLPCHCFGTHVKIRSHKCCLILGNSMQRILIAYSNANDWRRNRADSFPVFGKVTLPKPLAMRDGKSTLGHQLCLPKFHTCPTLWATCNWWINLGRTCGVMMRRDDGKCKMNDIGLAGCYFPSR